MIKTKLKDIFATLYKNIVIILLIATASVVLSVGYVTLYSSASYTARGEVIVHNGNLGNSIAGAEGVKGVSFTKTCERLFNSQSFFFHLQQSFLFDSGFSVEELDEMIDVKAEGRNSLFMTVTVVCDDPEDAHNIAENCIYALTDYSRFISSSITINQVYLDEEAYIQKPDTVLLIITSLIAGAVVASVLVLIFESFNLKIKNADDYKAKHQVRLLGVVPDFESKKKEGK